jgi:hypothetical protein
LRKISDEILQSFYVTINPTLAGDERWKNNRGYMPANPPPSLSSHANKLLLSET